MSPFALPVPMKYQEAEVAELASFVADPKWALQQKLDGVRCLVEIHPEDGVTFVTHGGRPLKSTMATRFFPAIEQALDPIRGIAARDGRAWLLDGEIMGTEGKLFLFDAPRIPGECTQQSGVLMRWLALARLFDQEMPLDPAKQDSVALVSMAHQTKQKRELVRRVDEAGAEGVMAKLLTSPYEHGRRVAHSLKCKYVRTADVVVVARDQGGACNAVLAVYNEAGEEVVVGVASAIGKNFAQVGDVVECRYLFKHPRGHMNQTRMMHARYDKRPKDCGLEQFVTYSKEIVTP